MAATDTRPNPSDIGLNQTSQTERLGSSKPTRPEAIAPRQAAKKNGVRIDEMPKTRSAARCVRGSSAMWRNAKNAPRRIRPMSASANSRYRLAKADWNRRGKPVQHTTMLSTSHTLLTSHTGAIARSMR